MRHSVAAMYFLYSFVLVVFLAIAIWVYMKLTSGICKCSRHLVGKVVIVTGANSGIGFETAKDLAERGARVILACRNEARGVAARDRIVVSTDNPDVHYRHLDLASLTSVRNFADNINRTEKRLDILINNAAVYGSKIVKTEDGLVLGMQVNHFGPFLLTNLLLDKMKLTAPSRIINVASMAHYQGTIDLKNLNGEQQNTVNVSKMYSTSKLCNILMTVELDRRLRGSGVTANSLHPGCVDTGILTSIPVIKYMLFFLTLFCKNPWEGSQTIIHVAVAPELKFISGRYFQDCREAKPSRDDRNLTLARQLWEKSEKFVQMK